MHVDMPTDQVKSYMKIAALSDKGENRLYDGNHDDRFNIMVHLLYRGVSW